MYEWKTQGVEKFYNNVKALYLHKDFLGNDINNITAEQITQYNIVITTYDQCLSVSRKNNAHKLVCEYGNEGIHKDKVIAIHNRKKPTYQAYCKGPWNIFNIPWTRVISDESQRFANPKNYTFKAMMAIYADYKWCLTGTPIRNYDTDIWSQLRFCRYDAITESRLWRRFYFQNQSLNKYIFESNYKEENIEMPELVVTRHTVELNKTQKALYVALLIETKDLYQKMIQKFISYASVLAMFTRLRQICIAPYLVTSKKKNGTHVQQGLDNTVSKTKLEEWIVDKDGTAGIDSPKVKKIIEIIKTIPVGEKIILFSMFTSCLQLIEHALEIDLEHKCWEYLDGSTSGRDRLEILTNFKEDPNVNILLVHYKVGGEGLNLIEANHVICIEPWWCPAVHNQAIARCWRRGQNKPVNVHWIITDKTIEIPILQMCDNKIQLSKHYLYNDEYTPQPTGLNRYAMHILLFS